jgi:hypothetical protein
MVDIYLKVSLNLGTLLRNTVPKEFCFETTGIQLVHVETTSTARAPVNGRGVLSEVCVLSREKAENKTKTVYGS